MQHPRCRISEQIEHCVRITRHTLVKLPNLSGQCAKCFSRSSVQQKPQLAWLIQPCVPELTHLQPYDSKPHHTHSLSQRQDGMVWCVACGAWSGRAYRALKRRCLEQPVSGLQRLALSKLAKGLDPPGNDLLSVKLLPTDAVRPAELFAERARLRE